MEAVQALNRNEKELRRNSATFRINKWFLYKQVMKAKSKIELECTKTDAERYLHQEFDAREHDHSPVPPFLPTVSQEQPFDRIQVLEIREAFKKRNSQSASPGADGVSTDLLKQVVQHDYLAAVLCWAFNEIVSGRSRPPTQWCSIRVKMIPKGQVNPQDINEFRPIAVGSLVCKLLHAVMGSRLWRHCLDQGVIDFRVQKGFLPKVSGCVDHIHTLLQLLRSSHRSNSQLHLLLVDLRAAYNSVPHAKLWQVLQHIKVHPLIIQHLQYIYSQSTMTIVTEHWKTFPVPMRQGVMQGDTLSPLLFNIYFQTVLRAADAVAPTCQIRVRESQHFLKAYADDLTVMCRSEEHLKTAWRHLKQGLTWAALIPNARKCRILSMICGRLVGRHDPFPIDDETNIPCGVSDSSKFLGLSVALSQATSDTLKEMLVTKLVSKLEFIGGLNVPLLAKYFFYQVAVPSLFTWYFAIYQNIPFGVVEGLQQVALQHLRAWAGLWQTAPADFISSHKALGVTDLRTVYRSSRALTILNCLDSKDPAVVDAALERATEPTRYNMKDGYYHRDIIIQKLPKNIVRQCVRQLARNEQRDETIRKPTMEWLEDSIGEQEEGWDAFYQKLCESLPDKAVYTLIRFASDNMPVKQKLHQAKIIACDLCPLCKNGPETLKHVLNTCQRSLQAGRFTPRHDKVLQLIAQELIDYKRDERAVVWCDLPCYNQEEKIHPLWKPHINNWRPDIIIRHHNNDLTIVELTISFESLTNPSHAIKESKYAPTLAEIRRRNPTIAVKSFCVEVGSRGKIANTTVQLKHLLKHNKKDLRTFFVRLGRTSFLESIAIYKLRETPC